MHDVSPVGVPVCYRHPGRETYVRCTRCNRPICPDCMRDASVGHQCPECVAEGRRTQRPARTAFGAASGAGQAGYVTITLIAANIVMLLLSVLSAKNSGTALAGGQGFGGLIGGRTPLLDQLGVVGQGVDANQNVVPYGVADGEYYRLFTAMFMHFGIIHLLMNMWALWILGRPLEAMFGPARFLALYLICGLGGNVAAYVFQPGALSAGASTAVFGLFAVLFVALRRLRLSTSSVVPIIVINLIFTISVPGISIAGHVGGLITGALVGAGVAYAPRANRTAVQVAVLIGAVGLLSLLSLWQTVQLTA
ncbi:MAG: rhomboid family intramembrane serine protease [Actinobacteria bacterium 13_2_20CM_2_71_6]|nr:MAG: rhomboid family intramembrane serine protease [Actinobacteria bacterium 13_2_20CM_2_71_6]